jgi:hypothetical protein
MRFDLSESHTRQCSMTRLSVEHWFRTDDLHLLVVGISDAALTAACDGGKADVRYEPKLVDARVGELITAVNAERIAGFPNGPLFLDSAEQELAGALVDRQRGTAAFRVDVS